MNASSAPWSLTPSLQRSISLADGGSLGSRDWDCTFADDMLHVRCHGAAGAPPLPFSQYRDIFFFDFGITVLWGFEKEQEVQVCGVRPSGLGPNSITTHEWLARLWGWLVVDGDGGSAARDRGAAWAMSYITIASAGTHRITLGVG